MEGRGKKGKMKEGRRRESGGKNLSKERRKGIKDWIEGRREKDWIEGKGEKDWIEGRREKDWIEGKGEKNWIEGRR